MTVATMAAQELPRNSSSRRKKKGGRGPRSSVPPLPPRGHSSSRFVSEEELIDVPDLSPAIEKAEGRMDAARKIANGGGGSSERSLLANGRGFSRRLKGASGSGSGSPLRQASRSAPSVPPSSASSSRRGTGGSSERDDGGGSGASSESSRSIVLVEGNSGGESTAENEAETAGGLLRAHTNRPEAFPRSIPSTTTTPGNETAFAAGHGPSRPQYISFEAFHMSSHSRSTGSLRSSREGLGSRQLKPSLPKLGASLRNLLKRAGSASEVDSADRGAGGGRDPTSSTRSPVSSSLHAQVSLTPFNRDFSGSVRRVSALLWDTGGSNGSDQSPFEDDDFRSVGNRLPASLRRVSVDLQLPKMPLTEEEDEVDDGALDVAHKPQQAQICRAAAEDALADDLAAAKRQRWFKRICRAAAYLLLVVAVVVVVAVAIRAIVRGGSNPPDVSPEVSDEGGFVYSPPFDGDADANVAAICSEDVIQQPDGYDSCHDLCELAFCCFLPEFEPMSCAATHSEHCAPFEQYCAILELVERPGSDA